MHGMQYVLQVGLARKNHVGALGERAEAGRDTLKRLPPHDDGVLFVCLERMWDVETRQKCGK